MTHAEEIMKGVAALKKEGQQSFSRDDIRRSLNISSQGWLNGYTAIFQGMRSDHPGGAPKVGEKFSSVFRRLEHGRYELTEYGKSVLADTENTLPGFQPMNETLTLAQIGSRFDAEWILLADPEVNEHLEIQRGKLVWHSKSRDEVYQKAIDLRLKSSATLYTGEIPENAAVLL